MTTKRFIASLLLLLAAACGSGTDRAVAVPRPAPAAAHKLGSLASHQCADVPAPPAPSDEDAGGMCAAD